MTRKDFQLIASVIADTESFISSHPTNGWGEAVLQMVVDRMCVELKEQNPRFDRGRFEAYALPIKSAELKRAIVAQVKGES